MTVPVHAVKKIISCDGETRVWQFDYPLLAGETIAVWVKPPQGNAYQVTDHIEIDTQRSQSYTFVTYPSLSSGLNPLAAGYQITLLRSTPLQQNVTFETHVLPETLTDAFDKTVLQLQNLDEKISRCVQYVPDPSLTAADTNASTLVDTVCSQAREVIATAAADVEALVPTHNSSESAHADIRQAITSQGSALQTSLTAETTYRQAADAALQLNLTNLAGLVSQETSARQSADDTLQTQLTSQGEALSQLQTDVAGKQAAGDYVTSSAFSTALAGKQDALSQTQLSTVNSGATAQTVAQVSSNREQLETIQEELEVWTPNTQWIDLRNGALPNSIYFLVGHSADYSQFDTVAWVATLSTSANSYRVFIDGSLYGTYTSGATFELNWSTSTITTGTDVTYPLALRTHVIRITPAVSTDTITAISGVRPSNTAANVNYAYGTLWAHFEINNTIDVSNLFARYASQYYTPYLEAVTAQGDKLSVSGLRCFLGKGMDVAVTTTSGSQKISYLPEIDLSGHTTLMVPGAFNVSSSYQGNLREIRISNGRLVAVEGGCSGLFAGNTKLKKIITKNAYMGPSTRQYYNCSRLETLPPFVSSGGSINFGIVGFLTNNTSLKNTFLDFSGDYPLTQFRLGATSSVRLDNVKGVVFNNTMPFTGASPQVDVSYCAMDRNALVTMFNSLPTVSDSQVCNVTGCTGATDLTAEDITVATAKGWTVTR